MESYIIFGFEIAFDTIFGCKEITSRFHDLLFRSHGCKTLCSLDVSTYLLDYFEHLEEYVELLIFCLPSLFAALALKSRVVFSKKNVGTDMDPLKSIVASV